MQKTDRRIQRTHQALIDALIALTLEKGYDAITIRDIAERADIAYSTFFRHYADKGELLLEVLKSAVHDFKLLINLSPDKSRAAEGELIFQYVAQHQAFFRVLFSSEGTSHILEDIQEEIAADLSQSAAIRNSPIPPEIAANHLVVTILGLIRWWLEHDMPYPIDRMATVYSHLVT